MALVTAVIVLAVFVVSLIAIMSERVNDTAAALVAFGVSASAVYFIEGTPFTTYAAGMGWDIVLFVAAMMVVVSVVASSGLFQYAALFLALRSAGNPRRIFLWFMVLVFVMSLFFDPLPTMLIVSTFTVEVCKAIDADFKPYLMTEAVVAGLASMPTPIGSISNLVIVYLANIDVALMFLTLLPLSIILLGVTVLYMLRRYAEVFDESQARDLTDLFEIDPNITIKSKGELAYASTGMAVLILGLVLIPEQAAMVAVVVAGALLLPSRDRARDLFRRISWDTIFFLIGMMGIVQGLALTGFIDSLAGGLQWLADTNDVVAIMAMIFVPGGLMAPVDAKAVGILMAPAAAGLADTQPMVAIALVAGTNAGGYVVPFGDAPNMVAVSVSEKNLNPISWAEFNRVVFPLGVLHLVIMALYLAVIGLFT
jgi:Na+/H+ antiporter NhaD/arsenite permease-like protein